MIRKARAAGVSKTDHTGGRHPSVIARLWRGDSGNAIIEFAIVGPMFIAIVITILNIVLIYLTQASLETTAEYAKKLILTGQAQNWGYAAQTGQTNYNSGNGMTQSDFKNAICSSLSGPNQGSAAIKGPNITYNPTDSGSYQAAAVANLSCGNLYIDVRPESDYANSANNLQNVVLKSDGTIDTTALKYQLGGPGDIMVIKIIYLWPTTFAPMGINFATQPTKSNMRIMIATAVFANDSYVRPS